ncbi:MAG: hypothetical protein SPL70_04450 [Cyanobacteriota bacterium]|nr:hypothetical protein [Cyanobacteriota bacterium]MDY6383134.1 hypothetical protein [Cyanobacteriota bacterium]
MNFFEIINNCLLELNYRQVNNFSELIKNDHKKLISIINIINKEICSAHNWNFLLRNQTIIIPKKSSKWVQNPVNGRILHLIIDNKKYKFVENFEQFLLGQGHDFTYSICNDKLFFPKFKTEKTAQVIYYSKNCAVSKNGTEKEDLTDPDDCSLIPMPFAQQLLTYGACLRLKANPSYIRFSYWMSMYKEALVNLKSKTCIDSHYSPHVILHRQ